MMFFGFQLRAFIAGLLFAYFVIPFVQRTLINKTARPAAA